MRARMGMARKTLLRDAEEAADLVLLPRGNEPRAEPQRPESPYGSRQSSASVRREAARGRTRRRNSKGQDAYRRSA